MEKSTKTLLTSGTAPSTLVVTDKGKEKRLAAGDRVVASASSASETQSRKCKPLSTQDNDTQSCPSCVAPVSAWMTAVWKGDRRVNGVQADKTTPRRRTGTCVATIARPHASTAGQVKSCMPSAASWQAKKHNATTKRDYTRCIAVSICG